ncbi:beta-galactosidase [Parasphingopyxis algicola]|uniref:beta-galactosidase n=1 Tax=Parasphingopyxis algicola TaxID=2026624 RepID=UPI0015A26582|nr:beta-galactosidase [Parasphingopyxis algicola]QLC25369.1 beta-galactosidase [Parasphingopyxis algicola]
MSETTKLQLGVCYYPEHWPEDLWGEDARRMAELGIDRVRIGEFAWSRIEPEPGRYDWNWLDRAIATLAGEGLGIILGTPTATPPKWLVDRMPDMLALDVEDRPRGFGSRRHYCFSHEGYRAECARIVAALAERYGENPAIAAWQTDNEYGCHNTTLSYSGSAAAAFRLWLAEKYGDVDALNRAWGTVFWSQDYRSFDAVNLPNLTVTEPNPAHVLDFRRFSSDQVASFNRLQADILREHSPGRDIVHNFMGFYTEFDHHAVGRDLDVATWDSYPLGFLEQFPFFPEEEKQRYARQGHPDVAAFHHDLYRGCSGGRWWVMEQQPGPVNWARFNPAPLPGMVRLWNLEALAHGAELVSYFRWRQAPFAQEQMHSGLLRPDSSEDVAFAETIMVAEETRALPGPDAGRRAPVALLFSYEAQWLFDTQPQGRSFRYIELAFALYSALRRLGLDIDIVAPDADLSGYRMAVAPSLPILRAAIIDTLAAFDGPLLIGPRSGSKTADFQIPAELPPGPLQSLLPLKVVRVESLRDGLVEEGGDFSIARWIEHVETDLDAEFSAGGRGIVLQQDLRRYLAGWPDDRLLASVLGRMAAEAGLETLALPADLRVRRHGDHVFAFNHGPDTIALADHVPDAGADGFLIGSAELPPAGVAVWRG